MQTTNHDEWSIYFQGSPFGTLRMAAGWASRGEVQGASARAQELAEAHRRRQEELAASQRPDLATCMNNSGAPDLALVGIAATLGAAGLRLQTAKSIQTLLIDERAAYMLATKPGSDLLWHMARGEQFGRARALRELAFRNQAVGYVIGAAAAGYGIGAFAACLFDRNYYDDM